MRTHYCGEVGESLIGRTIEAAGWVHRRRDHGGVIFVDLRDRSGLLQVVFDPDAAEAFAQAERLGREFVIQVLGKLRAVFKDGVQTGGNSSALTDAAASALVASGAVKRDWGGQPLARLVAAAAVGVPPEVMGIGPAPAIRLLLDRAGLKLDDIARFEINEAQGAQTLAVQRELGLDPAKLNAKGGAIALGHPLAATGVRLTITVARQLQEIGARWGVVARRALPLIGSAAMIAAAAVFAKLEPDLAQDSVLRMLIFHAPPIVLVILFSLNELPRVEIPPLPRRPRGTSWRRAADGSA